MAYTSDAQVKPPRCLVSGKVVYLKVLRYLGSVCRTFLFQAVVLNGIHDVESTQVFPSSSARFPKRFRESRLPDSFRDPMSSCQGCAHLVFADCF